ncbi:MAG: SDR family oxidoreductase [Hyphomicrobiaceae bacterium]
MALCEVAKSKRCILVLGAYGLIGSWIVRHLIGEDCEVVGLGRNELAAHSVLPQIRWLFHDLADLCSAEAWLAIIKDVDVVVNCAGALQEGMGDDLEIVHHRAIEALVLACNGTGVGVVQISAVGSRPDASTAFLRTKAAGDAVVRAAQVPYWIFRPGMVISPTAYGGSALLRTLAAFPIVQPLANADAAIQTVSIKDLGQAVSLAVHGKVPARLECDLVEETPHALRDLILEHRRWLGFAPPKRTISIPGWMLAMISRTADLLGLLGWRSPLRSTATRVLEDGVLGDPSVWQVATGKRLSSLLQTLAAIPATVEHRQFARMSLLMPFAIGVLFVFWLASGLIGLIEIEKAAQVLRDVGWPNGLAIVSVAFWGVIDIAIAFSLLVRKYAMWSCVAMVIVSLIYLASATVIVPTLWIEPLGPLVKVLPGIMLAVVTRAMLETR